MNAKMTNTMNTTSNQLSQKEKQSVIKTYLTRFFMLPVLLGILILIPAGTTDYWQVFVYMAMLTISIILVFSYFLKNDPKLMERRTRRKEKEKAQLMIQLIFSLLIISGYVMSGLDKRFEWSKIPVNFVLIADILILSGFLIIFFVFRQNSYASNIVEVNNNQKVITGGLYKWVRHPMYVGLLLLIIPTPIALGSYWGLIPIVAIPGSLVLRILNEESVLKRELPGYKEYCQTTKYRLIPSIW
jgi:protein-S-isoprenylcysteine O-methyltransferase Ste14